MSRTCPTCGGSGEIVDADPVESLRGECLDLGIRLIGDLVSEGDAATLLGRSKKTLKRLRQSSRPIEPVNYMGAIYYRLSSVAAFREANIGECSE